MNTYILFIAISYFALETSYFGWDMTPKTDGEMICDGIAFLILALAFLAPSK